MPFGFSTARFWFSTDLDPIEDSRKDPQRYFYGHWSDEANQVVETRKARIGKKRGADYWEPYRWSKADGMAKMPDGDFEGKAKDRWNPVKRASVYINLKTSFGSFDRYFYFEDGLKGDDKREAMLREARRLKSIVDYERSSYRMGGRERVFENRMLSSTELTHVSQILGREYESARLVRHSLYPGNRGQDLSVIFRRGARYSEAFAGSGEIAAVTAVTQMLAAPDYSLVLLDEPETSLHPGAQRAMLRFLLEQIKLKKHQVVLSTHSMDFLAGLPHEAIKVFEDNGKMQTRILPSSSPSAALKRLGKVPENKCRVLVEDALARLLVQQAAKGLDHGDADTLEVTVAPGGAESILKYAAPSAMLTGAAVFVYLDGDKRKVPSFTDPQSIAPDDYSKLEQLLKGEVGCDPVFHVPGGDDVEGHLDAKRDAQLEYLAWIRKRVDYLPKKIPEQIVLEAAQTDCSTLSTAEIKSRMRAFLAEESDAELTAADLHSLAKVKIAKMPVDNPDLVLIRSRLKSWLHG